jgi:hypothetical protein
LEADKIQGRTNQSALFVDFDWGSHKVTRSTQEVYCGPGLRILSPSTLNWSRELYKKTRPVNRFYSFFYLISFHFLFYYCNSGVYGWVTVGSGNMSPRIQPIVADLQFSLFFSFFLLYIYIYILQPLIIFNVYWTNNKKTNYLLWAHNFLGAIA